MIRIRPPSWLPEPIRYGIFSGSIIALFSGLLIWGGSLAITAHMERSWLFTPSFRIALVTQAFFLSLFTWVIWAAIAVAYTAFLIPEARPRLHQSMLFYANSVVAIATLVLGQMLLFAVEFLLTLSLSFVYN